MRNFINRGGINIMQIEFMNGTLIDGKFYYKCGQCIIKGQNFNIKDFVEGKVDLKNPWTRTVNTEK